MLTDRYGLPLSTASSAARDAYVEGCQAKLTMYPGAIEARIGPSTWWSSIAEFASRQYDPPRCARKGRFPPHGPGSLLQR